MNKCRGCGAAVQTVDPTRRGYVRADVLEKRSESFYCERCYNLIHYNRPLPIDVSDVDMQAFIKEVAKSKSLIVNVVDVFDLEGTYVPGLNRYFPNNPIFFVANKFDLFPQSVKRGHIENYVREFLKEKGLSVSAALVLSSRRRDDLDELLALIRARKTGAETYFFGTTNVGKSTLINALVGRVKKTPGEITVSGVIGTTLDFIKAELEPDLTLIDMPGIVNDSQATYYLDFDNQKKLVGKKTLRPRVYQLDPGQALFLGGFCYLKFISGQSSSFVVYVSPAVPVHRVKLTNADGFYERHRDDLLEIPTPAERKRLGNMITREFAFGPEKSDIAISGLGFVTLVGEGRVAITCFEKIRLGIRKAII